MAFDDSTRRKARNGVLIIVENLPVPFDRRVWQEARALRDAGYSVAVICPKGKGHTASKETLEGIHIYRHPLPLEASSASGFLLEYTSALFWEFVLSLRVRCRHGFNVVQGCNPPDLIFLVALVHKILFGAKFIFDHHDVVPELFEAKFGKRGLLHRLLIAFERWTFRAADASIATNETFRRIAIERGGMAPDRVWVVRSYPDLGRFRRAAPDISLRRGRQYLVGYVGVMGKQDGVDHLLLALRDLVHERRRGDIHCLLIGDGPELLNLKAMASALDVADFITFTGYLTGESLMTHLSSFDVGVIPDPVNVYNDKISMNKVFEYMALGIPFVHYDLAETRGSAGEAALVARSNTPNGLGDAIIDLLDDPERRQVMSRYGKAYATTAFDWANEKHTYLDAYAAVTSKGDTKETNRRAAS
jgi:glycosyltransferase involved in cell wall biosynthesis